MSEAPKPRVGKRHKMQERVEISKQADELGIDKAGLGFTALKRIVEETLAKAGGKKDEPAPAGPVELGKLKKKDLQAIAGFLNVVLEKPKATVKDIVQAIIDSDLWPEDPEAQKAIVEAVSK